MSNRERKLRKRAGVKFERAPKVGTPLTERFWFSQMFPVKEIGAPNALRPRSLLKRNRALAAHGLDALDS